MIVKYVSNFLMYPNKFTLLSINSLEIKLLPHTLIKRNYLRKIFNETLDSYNYFQYNLFKGISHHVTT